LVAALQKASHRLWSPTREQEGLFVDLMTARLDRAKIAAAFGIDMKTLTLYLARLAAAEDAPYS
jgi:hypothetical protein